VSARVAVVRRGAHPVVIAVLTLCAAWLIVQNALLLLLVAWAGPQSSLAVGRALVRVGVALLTHAWWLPLATLAVVLLFAHSLRAEGRREVRHGG
jgi:hypothetical protein